MNATRKISLVSIIAIFLQGVAAFSASAVEPETGIGTDGYKGAMVRDAILQSKELTSSLYGIAIEMVDLPLPRGSRSSIASIDAGIFYISNIGKLYFRSMNGSDRGFIPIGRDLVVDKTASAFRRFEQAYISVLDIAARKNGEGKYTLFASYIAADDARGCLFIRVMKNEVAGFVDGLPVLSGDWVEYYRTKPCLPVEKLHHELISLAGGRIAFHDGSLYLSVGTLNWEKTEKGTVTAQDPDYDYGKILRFAGGSNEREVYSLGHRNPQGLFINQEGTVFETEHGPQGGDEINIVEKGGNYGWPMVSYGVQYETHRWEWSIEQQRHSGFRKPIYAFVPSIGISQTVQLRGKGFPEWAGDLMVASLRARSIYHVRVDDGRVIFAEPIFIGERVRDIEELADGRIAFVTDSALFGILSAMPDDGAKLARSTEVEAVKTYLQESTDRTPNGDVTAGEAAFQNQCMFCHDAESNTGAKPGPGLFCVFGRRVASNASYPYTFALRSKSDQDWGAENLRAFLSEPVAWAPGTAMNTRITGNDLDDLIAYLYSRTKAQCGQSFQPAKAIEGIPPETAQICETGAAVAALKACTSLIEQGDLTGDALATVFENRALAYRQSSDLQNAISDLGRAITLNPMSVHALMNRADTYVQKHNFELAIEDYSAAIRLNPRNDHALLGRGIAHMDNNEPRLAIADFDESIKLNGKAPIPYNMRGDAHARLGEHDLAIADYDRAIELDPNYAKAYYNRGNAYTDRGDLNRALSDYSKAIELAPTDGENFNKRAIAYRDARKFAEAMADFQKAIDLDPMAGGNYYHRGLAHSQLGDFDAAIKDYSEAMRLDQAQAYHFYERGLAYKAKGDLPNAVSDLGAAISRDPTFTFAYFNRALAYSAAGQADLAVEDFNKALELDAGLGDAYYNRGLILKGKGQIMDAVLDFNKAIAINPSSAFAFFNRGLAYQQSGDTARARADCTEAVRLDPALSNDARKAGLGCIDPD